MSIRTSSHRYRIPWDGSRISKSSTFLKTSLRNCQSAFKIADQFSSAMEELIVDFNKLQRLPDALGFKLVNLRKLSVHSNKLSNLPSSISHLISLRVLDIHRNKLPYLPEDIERLVNLQILIVSHNSDNFKALPDSICRLLALVELDVSYNQIKRLPDLFGDLVQLKRLNLEGNPIIVPPPRIVGAGPQAVQKYMTNRATKGLLLRSFSFLARKLPRRRAFTGGRLAFRKGSATFGKSMTWHKAKFYDGLLSGSCCFNGNHSPSTLQHLCSTTHV